MSAHLNSAWWIAAAVSVLPTLTAADEHAIDQLIEGKTCEPIYTVQKRGCSVEHVYACDTENGKFWRYEVIWESGVVDVEITDTDGMTLRYVPPLRESGIVRVLDVHDPMSLDAVRAVGLDDYYIVHSIIEPSFLDPIPSESEGRLIDTRETLEVDGVQFLKIRDERTQRINALTFEGVNDLYLDMELGYLVIGEMTETLDGTERVFGGVPADVIRPDEPGFLHHEPFYDCGEISNLSLPDDRRLKG